MADDLPALLAWLQVAQGPSFDDTPLTVDAVCDGTRIAAALRLASPADFEELDLRSGADNWVMWRANLNRVVDKCTAFAIAHLSSPMDSDSSLLGVDTNAIARDKDSAAVAALLRFALTLTLLGGGPECVNRVKGLPKDTQLTLQKAVKAVSSASGLKKRKAGAEGAAAPAAATKAPSVETPAAAVAPLAAAPADHSKSKVGFFGAAHRLSDEDTIALQQDLADLRDRCAMADAAKLEFQERLTALQADKDGLNQRYQALLETTSKSDALRDRERRDELAAKEAELHRAQTEVHTSADKIRELQRELLDVKARANADVAAARNDAVAARTELQRVQNELQLSKDLSNAQSRDRSNLEQHVVSAEKERSEFLASIESWKAKYREVDAQNTAAQSEIVAARAREAQLQARLLLLEHHGDDEDDGGRVPAPSAAGGDASPAPKVDDNGAIAARERQIDALRAELEHTKKHLSEALKARGSAAAAAAASVTAQAAKGTLSAEEAQQLQDRLRQLEKQKNELEQSLVDTQARMRDLSVVNNAALFECGQRNLALRLQLSDDRISSTLGVMRRDDATTAHKSFLQQIRERLELGPLLAVAGYEA